MKKICSHFFSALLLMSFLTTSVVAKVTWSGSQVSNVRDETLVIKGDVTLPAGATRIEAINSDVVIDIQDKAATIKGHSDRESQLYLTVANGHKIRFEVDHAISFIGSHGGKELLIVQSGLGVVEFAIEQGGDNDVSFTSHEGTGGTKYYIFMGSKYHGGQGDEYYEGDEYWVDEYNQGDEYNRRRSHRQGGEDVEHPTLRFVPLFGESYDKNITIKIGKDSQLSYLSHQKIPGSSDTAIIEFNAANTGTGRMVLEIGDKAGFTVAGHYSSESNGAVVKLNDIDLKTAAGNNAMWSIINSNNTDPQSFAGLLVLNKNHTLFDLLFDPFLNLGTRSSSHGFKGKFDGERFGVVVGANGQLSVGSGSYLDYVGLTLNRTPHVSHIPGQTDIDTVHLIKMRNPSALFIDGNHNPSSTPAKIIFGEHAALFLRSGVASDGSIRGLSKDDPFTVDPSLHTDGAGNIVFDIEGELNVFGPETDGSSLSKIELLSLEVDPMGGSLLVGTSETNFPLRTFAKDDNDALLQYNCGAFLINNQVNLFNTSLSHTDQCHQIFQKNDVKSEPAYIGGETFILAGQTTRPSINFYNSILHVNTDMAITGFDLVTPNFVDDTGVCQKNLSSFIFYSNGYPVDSGTGRSLILGTQIGAQAADECTVINCDAHLDVIQLNDCFESAIDPNDPDGDQTLVLSTAANDTTINESITDTSVFSIQTIFLGCNSNISIGTNADTTGFEMDTHPWLHIEGNLFSFETKGGQVRLPDTANITGTGGIFVDLNGKISIDSTFRANVSTMVTKSRNAIIDLPSAQVFFDNRVGIADWLLDLTTPSDLVIVEAGQNISDYTLNWILTKKDPAFVPFETGNVSVCECPPVTEANITSLPTIQGVVDQFQLQGTRLGDPAHILIDGGHIRELVFLDLNLSAEAPVAVVVLRNNGRVGLGSAHRSRDSLDATTTLGVNGVTIIADGSGTVDLNEDIIVDNICAFVRGPNFQEGDTLTINSNTSLNFLIKSSGTLDFASFTSLTDIVEFGGNTHFSIEAGATIITGEGTLRFSENATIDFEPTGSVSTFFNAIPLGTIDNTLDPLAIVDASEPHNQFASLTNFGSGLSNTDQFRSRIVGPGTLEFVDNARVTIPFNAFVGVETVSEEGCEIPTTNLTIVLRDSAQFNVGNTDATEGGVFQIGNVTDLGPSHSVSFTLTIDGNNADFTIGSLGFVGLGVGVERAITGSAPNDLIVNTLSNIGGITLNFNNGRFVHDRIFSGDDSNASLLAISGDPTVLYTLTFAALGDDADLFNFAVLGGGNMVLVRPGEGGLMPIVLTDDGDIEVAPGVIHPRLRAGIMASTSLQDLDENEINISGETLFDELKTHDATLEVTRPNTIGLANAASAGESVGSNVIRVGTVSNDVILRTDVTNVVGTGTQDELRTQAVEEGFVAVVIDPATNTIVSVIVA